VLVAGLRAVGVRGRVVAAGVVDEVGRVRGHEPGLLTVHHYRNIVWVGGVTAEEAMVSEQPEVTGFGDRFFRELRDVVRVGQAAFAVKFIEELLEVAFAEAEEVEVRAVVAQLFEECGEVILFPFTPLGVVTEGAFAGELLGDVDQDRGELGPAEVLGCALAHVAGIDRPVGLGQDGPALEKVGVLFDAPAEVLGALVRDGTGVPGCRLQGCERDCDRFGGLGYGGLRHRRLQ
jgi:hypothetical protein